MHNLDLLNQAYEMRVVCLGVPFHESTFDLSNEQDVLQPTSQFRPRYLKRYQIVDYSQAFFASSHRSETNALELLGQHVAGKASAVVVMPGTCSRYIGTIASVSPTAD